MEHKTKNKKWLVLAVVVIFVFLLATSYFLRRDAIPGPSTPSNYSYGVVASFLLDTTANTSTDIFTNASAQIILLGQKPLLRIENMNVTSCPSARVLLRDMTQTDSKVNVLDLGRVPYLAGHTNYELPLQFNITKPYVVSVWCDATDAQLGYANLQ